MQWFQLLFITLILIALAGSVFYSFRYRRQRDPAAKGLSAAKMNISMGALLLLLALMQATLFEMSTLRLVMATLFALIGLFNLFAGFKNRSYYRTLGK
ncbi:YtpI family protein [Gorillibacterium sp. sgz5001074]|uniref:YtpI family protein n=1 Tax=Gorillibacterium sp. sgz5001074 TaxID=3446695 RepID=UPI003F67D165